jgi:hypothetical protein
LNAGTEKREEKMRQERSMPSDSKYDLPTHGRNVLKYLEMIVMNQYSVI